MLRYLHHIWFDPLSASETFALNVIAMAIVFPILLIAIPLMKDFWKWYNDE